MSERSPAGGGQRLTRDEKLRRRSDYLRCYRQGRRLRGTLLTLHTIKNQCDHPRLGITASRKVGKAVVRQRLKRRVREIYRRWNRRSELPAHDLVVHLQPAAAQSDFSALAAELLGLFGRVLPRASAGAP
ncbi:MAG TPA: ribonuclease P protein component [Thermoanaerobaculia bacterium]|nr:ribonuclease P protein component [Thermoanaerobaculia bacterium]